MVDAQRRDRLADCANWLDLAKDVVVVDHHVLNTSAGSLPFPSHPFPSHTTHTHSFDHSLPRSTERMMTSIQLQSVAQTHVLRTVGRTLMVYRYTM